MTARHDLTSLGENDSRLWHDGFGWGFVHGITRGRALAEAEMLDAWRPVVAHVRGVARGRTHEELGRLRSDVSTARPVPTYEECQASWRPLLERRAA